MSDSVTIHGNLLCVRGIGVLLTGEPGSGKTHCSVELVRRGCGMIADDAVRITRIAGELVGSAPTSTKGLLHVRGLGLVQADKVFGKGAVVGSAVIKLCVELVPYHARDIEVRCGTSRSTRILGVDLPAISIVPAEFGESAVRIENAVDELFERIT